MTLNPFKALENYYAKTQDNFGSGASRHLEHMGQGARQAKLNGVNGSNQNVDLGKDQYMNLGRNAAQTSSTAEIREWLNSPTSRGITI